MLFLGGLALATLPLLSPLDDAGERFLLSGHMLQHVLIGDAAPLLLVLALRGPLLIFLLPGFALRPLARLRPLRAALAFLLRPKVSLLTWALVLGAWHTPAAYEYALTHQPVHDLEHAFFLLAGLLVWSQLVDPARRRELRLSGRIAFAVAMFAAGQVLAYVLIFSFTPIYSAYASQEERLLGLSPLTDQRLAGAVMMAEQLLTLGACVGLLLRAYVRNARSHTPGARVSLSSRT